MNIYHNGSKCAFFNTKSFIAAFFTLILSAVFINAQTDFSESARPRIKGGGGYFSDQSNDPQGLNNNFNPNSPTAQNRISAGSRLDSTFNASVTEGTGYIFETAVQTDGKIIAVGSFNLLNTAGTLNIARLNPNGTLDETFNAGTGAGSTIRAVAIQPDGKIIVAGLFTTFNNQPYSRILRLNTDGSIDSSFNAGTTLNNEVYDVVIVPNGKIMVGGRFSYFGGSSSTRLLRLNPDGTVDSTFTGSISASVYKILPTPDGKFLLGLGNLFGIKRVNANGTEDTTFNSGVNFNGSVFEVALQDDGKILVGGQFYSYNNMTTDSVARLNSDGSLDQVFQIPGLPDGTYIEVNALAAQPGGKFIISYFWQSDENKNGLIRFNSDGTQDTSFNTGDSETEPIFDLNPQSDGGFIVAGSFTSYNNQEFRRVIKINSQGVVDNSVNYRLPTQGIVWAIKHLSNGKIMVGGNFNYINGERRNNLALLNSDGTLDSGFNPNIRFSSAVRALAVQNDGKIIAGGTFYGTYNGNNVHTLVRFNPDGSFVNSYNTFHDPLALYIDFVYSLELQSDGKLLVGGQIFNGNNGYNYTLARFNTDGLIDNAFTSLTTLSSVFSIVVQPDDKIVIGGSFRFLDSSTINRTGIAGFNANGSLDTGFTTNLGIIFDVERQADGKILAGGLNLSRFSATGVLEQTLNSSPLNNYIRAIKPLSDGKILIGGNFTTYNGVTVNKIARVNSDGSLDTSFNTGDGTNGNILAFELQPDGKVLVGGQFAVFDGTAKNSLVRLTTSPAVIKTPFDFDGDGKADLSVFRPSNGAWYIQRSQAGFTGVTFGFGSDVLTPADFDGDGKTDFAIFRPSDGGWYRLNSSNGTFTGLQWGQNGDVPIPGDFDGDGKADVNVFRPADGGWYRLNSSNGAFVGINFGQNGDKPLIANFDGDAKSDLAVFRPSTGSFYSLDSSTGTFRGAAFGFGTDIPTPADFDGDGKTDVAVFRPSNGSWYRLNSSTGAFFGVAFGQNGDIPVAADYDGDGKADVAVFRNGNWYYLNSSNGAFVGQLFGLGTDKPIPSAFQ